MNLRKLFPFLNKKETKGKYLMQNEALYNWCKEQRIKDKQEKDAYILNTPLDEKIEHSVASYIYRHNKAPNVIIVNNQDLKDFKKVIGNNVVSFKPDLNGEFKYRGIDVIRSVYLEKGNVFVAFISPELI